MPADTPGEKYHYYRGKHYFETSENMKKIISRDVARELLEEKTGLAISVSSFHLYF